MVVQEIISLQRIHFHPEVKPSEYSWTIQFYGNKSFANPAILDIRFAPLIGSQILNLYSTNHFIPRTIHGESVRSSPNSWIFFMYFAINHLRSNVWITDVYIVATDTGDDEINNEHNFKNHFDTFGLHGDENTNVSNAFKMLIVQ